MTVAPAALVDERRSALRVLVGLGIAGMLVAAFLPWLRVFRHSFAKVALEGGRPIAWLSRHLGHSSVSITDGVYGHFERSAKKREVEAMAGVFGV